MGDNMKVERKKFVNLNLASMMAFWAITFKAVSIITAVFTFQAEHNLWHRSEY